MKTKLLAVALLASAALIAPLQAGGGNHGGGGISFAGGGGRGAVRSGGVPSFGAMSARSFGSNRMIYSGQRFSSIGSRSMEFRPRYLSSSADSIRARQFAQGTNSRVNRASHFANSGNRIRNGNGNLRTDWQRHVFAQHSANWHRDWDRSSDHWWHGHRCHFFNGAWFIFDAGFDPWWPWWDYPYEYYGYGYGYPYPYSYDYEYDSRYYDSGVYDDQNGYVDQSGNSTIAAVQERLARDGSYRGQIDGVFGQETRAAIAEYQSNHSLRVTGALTNETLAALGLRRVASY